MELGKIRHLIFDLDGTLVDTSPGITYTVNQILTRRKQQPLSSQQVKSFVGEGLTALIESIEPEAIDDRPFIEQLVMEFRSIYRQIYLKPGQSVIYPGVLEFLQQWPGLISIVSNKSEEFVRGLVTNSSLGQFHWSALVGGDTFAHKKPHPEPVQSVLTSTGTFASHCAFVGDGLPDIGVCMKLVIPMIAIDFGFTDKQLLIDAGAQHFISSYSELPQAISSLG